MFHKKPILIAIGSIVAVTIVVGVIAAALGGVLDAPAPPAPTQTPVASQWSDCNIPFLVKEAIKDNLNDPGSFEWQESALGIPTSDTLFWNQPNADGQSTFIAYIRSRNSFNALVPSKWAGPFHSLKSLESPFVVSLSNHGWTALRQAQG